MQTKPDAYYILQLHPSAALEVVEAAYRALARLRHPDHSDDPNAADSMAELNWAYRIIRDPQLRAAYDRTRVPIPVTPQASTLMERMRRSEAGTDGQADNPRNVVLDFGRYAGMTLGQLARTDRAYLEWLRRHISGIRYRHQIDAVLGVPAGGT